VLINWTDILDGEIVNAAWAVAQMAVKPRASRRVAAALDTAAWGNTDLLSKDALADIPTSPELPDLSKDEVRALKAALKRHEVHGALQALLATRLTDAPEHDAAQAREAVRLAIGDWLPEVRFEVESEHGHRVQTYSQEKRSMHIAGILSEYFDEKISGLVGMLEGRVGFAGLAQVRAEAYNARIVALLGAIDRQVAALADLGRQAWNEDEFLQRYRRQAHLRHGFLTPPDFDRRRRVAVADIYVPTGIEEGSDSERDRFTPGSHPGSLKVWDLIGRLGRTVLLGDPGGGKTTAVNVLADHFARAASRKIPLVVTLREYAAKTPIEWSVVGYIEHSLKTVYQSPAPDGLVERLLLTGRAIVVFDGLDELLDTSRRRDVSDRVEQFCSAYPLTQVLVTSRVVGYDQARLDDAQFTCYRLGGFGDDEVAEYARKWFGTQEGMPTAEAEAKAASFLAESADTRDLRANPLLLSLMCILYRGSGSLPGDRAGIYARCAELLLRKWDEQRDLYQKLGADHLVEPTLRYLAWWLFTREDSQAAATEREMTAKVGEFLYGRAYETQDEAQVAAREFVNFCRGRMWVFSDAGTTASGGKLYGFTHRTFLEYFAAWHLAVSTESPEDLGDALASRVASGGWRVVGELAIKIKSDTIDRGSDRIYAAMLNAIPAPPSRERGPVLTFLTACLQSARPSPATARKLIIDIIEDTVNLRVESKVPLDSALPGFANYEQVAADEIATRIATMAESPYEQVRQDGLHLLCGLAWNAPSEFWQSWAGDQINRYAADIVGESASSPILRSVALEHNLLTVDQALAMCGSLDALTQGGGTRFFTWSAPEYVIILCDRLQANPAEIYAFASIGRHLSARHQQPWAHAECQVGGLAIWDHVPENPDLDNWSGLGVAASLAIHAEIGENPRISLAGLPMPAEFRKIFDDWTAGQVDFVEFTGRK
jgi:NACHT domain